MPLKDIAVSRDSLYRLLQECTSLAAGRQVHELIAQHGFVSDFFLASHLIRMFTFFKSLSDARQVFHKLASPSAFVWSAIISAHTQLGQAHKAIDLYAQMQQQPDVIPNEFVFISVLKACMKAGDAQFGRLIHTHVLEHRFESKISVSNTLIDCYIKCGDLEDACKIFNSASSRDVVTWNTMIGGYGYNKQVEKAVFLFEQMQKKGFEPNHVTWSALIGGCAQGGKGTLAFMLFEKMQMQGIHPGQATYVNIVQACSNMASLQQVKKVHAQLVESIFEKDFVIGSSLIDMYVKFSNLESARRIFDSLEEKDIITWNSMIAGYAQHGFGHLAFQLLLQMEELDIEADKFTFVSIIKASTSTAAVGQGQEIHSLIIERDLESDVFIGSALIDMYSKWERLENARIVFKTMPELNIVTWNALLSGYAQHGTYKEAVGLFECMKTRGLTPDSVTFICLLSACSHEGLVEEAHHHLEAMETAYGIKPSIDHYDCMLDMFGRAGYLNKALQFQESAPSYSPQDTDAVKVEEQRKSVGAQKKPGIAFIEIGNQVHHFLVGDVSYPTDTKPLLKMKRLKGQMLQTGYMPSVDLVLQLAPS